MSKPFALGTFSSGSGPHFVGMVLEEQVLPVRALSASLRAKGVPVSAGESFVELLEHWPQTLEVLEEGAREHSPEQRVPLASLRVHAPIPRPGTIYCSGANYRKHVVELIMAHPGNEETRGMSPEDKRAWAMRLMDRRAEEGTPFIFIKPQSSVTGPFDTIAVPEVAQKPDWELELAVVIGRRARRVSRDNALDYVAGYTIANDITLRSKVFRRKTDSPELGMDFVMAKGAPGFLPLGPYVVPARFVPDPQSLQLTLKLNGRIMQDESTADMIFTVARLIEYLSADVELQPGDILCTGSPAGNGAHYGRFIQDGDELEATITGLGVQRNRCVPDRS